MMKRLWNNEKGFTLMELIIVIVILGILALIAVPRLIGFTDQAEKAADKEYAAVVVRAAELYWAGNNKTAPTSITGANATDLVGGGLVDAPNLQYYASIDITVNATTGEAEARLEDPATAGSFIMYYTTAGGYKTTVTATSPTWID